VLSLAEIEREFGPYRIITKITTSAADAAIPVQAAARL